VDNVLTFTRAERDLFRITPVPLGLQREVSDAVALFAPLAQKAQVRFDVAVPAGVQVMMDQAAFRQVLVNLLDNAVRYGPPGQRVRIAASAFDADRAFVELVVTDEGPGVPAEAVERVLEPYVRLDREQERAAGGTGLGLAIVRDIMNRHGGAVRVMPTAPSGRGARVVLRLPRAESSREGDVAVTPIEAARGA
jgi:signal transduction histidine kinase